MILTAMTRRTMFQLAGAAAAVSPLSAQTAPLKGRLKQSVARWCYGKISLDDLAREGARMGLKGIDLID
jgi:hydroxypyruvate isomerase